MTPERWQRIEEICGEAFEVAADQRAAFLERACGDDDALRREVESLLAADQDAGDFIARPALGEHGGRENDVWIGRRIGVFEVLRRLGEGGMGAVYLARRIDGLFEQQVAIKLLRQGMPSTAHVERFRLEREVLARLEHPSIARLYDGGTLEDGRPYFVMEFIDGEPIDVFSTRHGLSLRTRLRLFRQVCLAVHYAHQNLIVHRDLKPSNILVTHEGVPKLLDFGIAKLLDDRLGASGPTRTWHRVLTPEYASPEQVRGDPITTGSDVYSLGALLYKLLAARPPNEFTGMSLAEIERQVIDTEPDRPSQVVESEDLRRRLRGDLDNIVAMALRHEPRHRYGSAERLAEDVERFLEGQPVTASAGTFRYRAGKFLRRNRVAVGVAAGFMLLILGATLALAGLAARLAYERDTARFEREKASQVANFLENIFERSDPEMAQGEAMTTREVLDRAARRIEWELHDQPEVRAAMRTIVGDIYRKIGHFEAAEPMLLGALATRQDLLGRSHPDVEHSLTRLAQLRLDQGEFEEAERLFRQAVAMQQDLFGEMHPTVVAGWNHLGRALVVREEFEEAEATYRRILEFDHPEFGPKHPERARTLSFLSELLWNRGQADDAAPYELQALKIRREIFGDGHLEVADSLNRLGLIRKRQGVFDEAKTLHGQALEIWRRVYGEDHHTIVLGLNNLASVATFEDDYVAAAEFYKQALDLANRALGPEHPNVAYLLLGLGGSLMQQDRLDAAEEYSRRALTLRRQTLGAEHWLTAWAEYLHGRCLLRQKRFADAEPHILRGWEILRAKRPPGDRELGMAVDLVIKLYTEWGRREVLRSLELHDGQIHERVGEDS